MNTVHYIFSLNLRALLYKRSLSQRDLAAEIDAPASSVSSWINGEKLPRADSLEKLAAFFEVHVADLFAEPGYTPSSPAGDAESLSYYTLQLEQTLDRLKKYAELIPDINKKDVDRND